MSLKQRIKKGAILAALGLTKQDAINAGIGMIARRALLVGYEENNSVPPVSIDMQHFANSLGYRRDLAAVGKKVRKQVFGKHNVFDSLMGVADDNSVAIRTLRDRIEYDDGDLELDDEMMDAFVGDAVRWLSDRVKPSVSSDSHDQISSGEHPSLLIDLRSLGQHITERDIYPERNGVPLTPVDPKNPWLRNDA